MDSPKRMLSKTGKRGLNKFAGLRTSKQMKQYGKAFTRKTGKSSYNIQNNDEFYKFVHKTPLKKVTKLKI